MKVYPKVPRHDHDVVPDDFFEGGTAYVTEKVDGGNFRFMLYDDRYADEMPAIVNEEVDPADGELVFGLKKSIRGSTADDVDGHDGSIRRAVAHLKEEVDRDAIRRIHDEYGPVVFFGENMAYHSLDYDYDTDPPPAILGFDVCVLDETDSLTRPPVPYEQTFEGFLSLPEAVALFEEIGVEPVIPSEDVEAVNAGDIDSEDYDVPESRFASDVDAEGVVIRKPDTGHRVKIVRPEFKELNRELWGWSESEVDGGNELFIARYCTLARVNKTINKMVVDEGRDLSMELIEDLWRRVLEDIWQEEWRSIMHDDIEFNPSEVKPLVASICRGAVERKVKNARLNDADPEVTFER